MAESIDIEGDNQQTYTIEIKRKINSSEGLGENTEYFEFSTHNEELTLLKAETIQPNGEVIKADEKAVSVETPYESYPMYDDAKVMKVTFPALQVGSITSVKFQLISRGMGLPLTMRRFMPNDWEKVIQHSISVTVDEEMADRVKYSASKKWNQEPKTFRLSDGRSRFEWLFKDIEPIPDEDYAPNQQHYRDYIAVSTIDSWSAVYEGYHKLMSGQAVVTQDINKLAASLVDGESDFNKKIQKLFNFVAQEIQYVGIEMGESGFKPFSASDVLNYRYGDCKGKSALLRSLLKATGIESHYALIVTRNEGFLEKNIPAAIFNHCIVAIPTGEGYLFVDPTAEYSSYKDLPPLDQDVLAMVLKSDTYDLVQTPIIDSSANLFMNGIVIDLSADGSATAMQTLTYTGIFASIERERYEWMGSDEIVTNVEQKIDSIHPESSLIYVDMSERIKVDEPFVIEANFSMPNAAYLADNLMIINMSEELRLVNQDLFNTNNRNLPLDMQYTSLEKTTIAIKIPKGFNVKYLPKGLRAESDIYDHLITYSMVSGAIIIEQTSNAKRYYLTPSEYGHILGIIDVARKFMKGLIILERSVEV